MKIEFELDTKCEPYCFAKTTLDDGRQILAAGETWQLAEDRLWEKLATISILPPPPLPKEITL